MINIFSAAVLLYGAAAPGPASAMVSLIPALAMHGIIFGAAHIKHKKAIDGPEQYRAEKHAEQAAIKQEEGRKKSLAGKLTDAKEFKLPAKEIKMGTNIKNDWMKA